MSKPSFSSEIPPGATSKKFIPSLLPGGGSPSKSFQGDSPGLSPSQGIFPFGRSLRDLEDRILKNVKDQALQIEKEAYEKGFAQGEKDGQELGLKRFESVLQSFQKILEEVQSYQKEYDRKHEGEMVRFLLTLARRVLRQEFPHAEETVAETLREAIQQVAERSSQATDSASRWFVGSSSSSRSGEESSSRASATRRRSPPESVVTSRSPSGSRSASIARSSVASRLQASARSIWLLHLRLLGEQRVEVGVRLGELRRDRR